MHGPLIKWNFMTDGSYVFLISIRTGPTVWNSSAPPRFPGEKRYLSVSRNMPVLEALLFSRSVRWFPRILIMFWKTAAMRFNRGYSVQHITNVMTVDLDNAVLDVPVTDVLFSNEIPDFWIHSLFDLKRTTNPIHRSVVPSMYRAILKETVCASITKNGEIIATGLGILDRDYIGIYAIHVREDYRRRGYARQICTGLLNEGKKRGASHAYLQVVKNNTSAEKLYSSLGFQYSYTYWFRVQPVGTRFQ